MPPAVAAGPLFRVSGLGKTYRTGKVVVLASHDVDLSMARGEFIVLPGASGSGKSTLLNIMGGWTRAPALRRRNHHASADLGSAARRTWLPWTLSLPRMSWSCRGKLRHHVVAQVPV